MNRCSQCKKKIGLLIFSCHECNQQYCAHCRLPEDHSCPNYVELKTKKKEELATKLMKHAQGDSRTHKL